MTIDPGAPADQEDRSLLEAAAALVARVPEGFVDLRHLAGRLGVRPERLKLLVSAPEATDRLGLRGGVIFDPARTSAKEMQARPAELQPTLPSEEALAQPPIAVRLAQRQQAVATDSVLRAFLERLWPLAHEVFELLNHGGTPCHLLTGEESIRVPGAQITASTIEMFSPSPDEACTVIDEAHMLADEQRGWAWTRALMEAQAPNLHVISAPAAGPLVERLADEAGMPLGRIEHKRLTPLAVSPRPWSLEKLPPQTILVAFSRAMALGLKAELERQHRRRVSIIYGALPPEVRRRQAARFAEGETEICVATDAVGMGLNLPADHVCFFEVEKFDGRQRRTLTPTEVRQIGGRAGRFGLSRAGLVGALNPADLAVVRRSLEGPEAVLTHARVAPVPEALSMLTGTLAERLRQWTELRSIPDNWRQLLRPVGLADAIELAELLTPREVATLGDADALLLVRAPASEDTRDYWRACAQAIVRRRAMPLPPEAPAPIRTAAQLTEAELSIRSADIYLWLSQRRPFAAAAPDAAEVREARAEATREVDAALQRKIDTTRRCSNCGRPLPTHHRYNLCTDCYRDPWRAG